METLLVSTGVVALAEIGDKIQLLTPDASDAVEAPGRYHSWHFVGDIGEPYDGRLVRNGSRGVAG